MNKPLKNTDGIQAIDDFLANIEAEAFRIAELATKNTVDAMDIIELAVKSWVKKHSHKPNNQWLFLFYKTLFTAIADFERKEIPVNRWFNPRNEVVCLQDIDPTDKSIRSAAAAEKAEFNKALIAVLGHLPLPQQQAFLLCEWQGFSTEQVAHMLAEAPLIFSNRLSSALAGLQEGLSAFNEEGDGSLTQSIIAALEESAADISYAQQYQLRHIRLQALKQKQSKPIIKWVVASGLMAVCLFVFWWLQLPEKTQEAAQFYSSESLTANEPQAWQESAELLGNLEFYAWLSMQEPVQGDGENTTTFSTLAGPGLSPLKEAKARQLFAQWNALPAEKKALLRSDFVVFSQFNSDFQQALRKAYNVYVGLPADRQQALYRDWQNAPQDVRQGVRVFMENARKSVE